MPTGSPGEGPLENKQRKPYSDPVPNSISFDWVNFKAPGNNLK